MDIVLYRQRDAPIADARYIPFLSLVTNLSEGEDAITEKFGKDCRYKIRRAETKDGLRMELITDPEEGICEILGGRVGIGDTAPLLGLMELAERKAG